MSADIIFIVLVILFSAVIHEVMHGVAANSLGDPTARLQGRLTLNPLKHIDPLGSVILPAIFALSHSPIFFGWAKPVPYNPYNLKPARFSEAMVAGAGPFSNLVIAILCSLVIRAGGVPLEWASLLLYVVLVNVMMALFNMIPIPPLDGSKVLSAFLPGSLRPAYDQWRMRMEYNPFLGFGIVLAIVLVAGSAFSSLIWGASRLLAGM